MQEQEKISLPVNLVQGIFDYLSKRPYDEVETALGLLKQEISQYNQSKQEEKKKADAEKELKG